MKAFKNKLFWIILTLLVLLSSPVLGALPKPSYDFYVYDEAGIIDDSVERYIIETNIELQEKTGAQVVIASIKDLEGMDINTYATKLFENWKIGSKEYDNGLLMLIVPNDRALWIEVGYGLEGILPDSRVKRIIDNNIFPEFKDGNYNNGIILGYEEILNYVESEYNIKLKSRESLGDNYRALSNNGFTSEGRLPNIFFIIAIIIFLFIDFRFFRGWLTFSLLRGLGRGGSGRGSGRGGSGGGGGRSGGGGAGGRW